MYKQLTNQKNWIGLLFSWLTQICSGFFTCIFVLSNSYSNVELCSIWFPQRKAHKRRLRSTTLVRHAWTMTSDQLIHNAFQLTPHFSPQSRCHIHDWICIAARVSWSGARWSFVFILPMLMNIHHHHHHQPRLSLATQKLLLPQSRVPSAPPTKPASSLVVLAEVVGSGNVEIPAT